MFLFRFLSLGLYIQILPKHKDCFCMTDLKRHFSVMSAQLKILIHLSILYLDYSNISSSYFTRCSPGPFIFIQNTTTNII